MKSFLPQPRFVLLWCRAYCLPTQLISYRRSFTASGALLLAMMNSSAGAAEIVMVG